MPTQAHPSIRGAMTAYVMAVLWLAEGLSRGEEKKRREVILAQMGRLTDNSNVAVDGEGATPRDGAEVGPLVVQSPRRAGEETGGQEAPDQALDDPRDLVKPCQERDGLEAAHIADDADGGDGDGPEDDQGGDEAEDGVAADDLLPPRDTERRPDDLGRCDADIPRGHVQAFVVREDLEGGLGLALGAELDEDAGDLLEIPGAVLGLGGVDLGDEALQFGAAPLDRVDLLPQQAEEASQVGRALLLGDPAGGDAPGLGLRGRLRLIAVGQNNKQENNNTNQKGQLDQLDLGLLQLEGGLVAFLDELLQLLRVARDPDVLDRGAEDLALLL